MPGSNPFDGFSFPEPIELEPLEPYQGVEVGYGGFDEQYGNDWLAKDGDNDEGFIRRAYQPYNLHKVGANYFCYITEGVIIDTHVRNQGWSSSGEPDDTLDDAARLTVPTINGVPIIQPCDSTGHVDPNWVRPKLAMGSDPIGFIYLHFCTDNHGWLGTCSAGEDIVKIIWSATEGAAKTLHHIPPKEGDPGEEGDYYFRLGATCYNADNDPVFIHEGHQSNFQWQEAFVTENWDSAAGAQDSAEEKNVLNGFMRKKDAFKMRAIKGCYALVATKSSTVVTLDWQGRNFDIGVITPATKANVYYDSAETCDEEARFRPLRQGGSTRQQIQIVQEVQDIIIQGNDADGTLTWQYCSTGEVELLRWEDGLITTIGDQAFMAGCNSAGVAGGNGVTGSLTLLDCDSAAQVSVTWVNGLVTLVGNHFFKAGCDSSGGTALTTVTGGYGLLASGTPTATDLDFDAENVGTGLGEIYVDSAGVAVDANPARFRRLDQTTENSNPQISPVKVGNTVEIRGNNVDSKIRWFKCNTSPQSDGTAEFVVVIRDGLVTADPNDGGDGLTAYDIIAECDSSGDVIGGYGLTATPSANTTVLDFHAENVGTGTAEVYVDSAGVSVDANPARFRRLAQTTQNAAPQIVPIKVSATNSVEIRGNNIDGSLLWNTCNDTTQFTLQWRDGLIITAGNFVITAGCDSSGWIPPT